MTALAWIGALVGCGGSPEPPGHTEPTSTPIACVGEATVETDGVPEAQLTRALDAQLRTVSDEVWDAAGSMLLSAVQARYDGDRMVERIIDDDGDGESDFTEVWSHGPDGALQRYELYYADVLSQTEDLTYDSDGRLVEEVIDLNADGSPEEVRIHVWTDGRVERIDTLNGGGTRIVTSSFSYPEPLPSLDHEERLDLAADGVLDDTILRAFDDAGRRIREEGIGPGVRYLLEQQWRPDGRLSFRSEATDVSLRTDRWDYSGDDLLIERITERDDALDGVLEWRTVEQWRWTCGD